MGVELVEELSPGSIYCFVLTYSRFKHLYSFKMIGEKSLSFSTNSTQLLAFFIPALSIVNLNRFIIVSFLNLSNQNKTYEISSTKFIITNVNIRR